MAASAAQKATLYDIFGLPPGGTISIAGTQVGSLSATLTDSWDVSEYITKIDARADALTTEQLTQLNKYITEWDNLCAGVSIELIAGAIGGMQGVEYSEVRVRKEIRHHVSRILGLDFVGFEAVVRNSRGLDSGRVIR